MKKVLALALALIMVFSMGTMAFADGTTTTAAATAKKIVCGFCNSEGFDSSADLAEHQAKFHAANDEETFRNECPVCGAEFADEGAYNDHIAICKTDKKGVVANISIQEIIAAMIELIKLAPSVDFSAFETIIVKLVDFVEKIGTAAVGEADVKGAVADLEAALAGVEIPGIGDLLNQLKQQIKDLYAGEVATTVEVTTEITPPAVTGSSSVGIALFAAVSVAAAAAYVCTKKSK